MSRPAPPSGRTAVYRLFDSQGLLLYVGLSHDPCGRYQAHARDKPWWPAVHQRKESWCDTRQEAEQLEKAAIAKECPAYNATGGDGANCVPRCRVGDPGQADEHLTALARLDTDIEGGMFPFDRLLPTQVQLAQRYGLPALAIDQALIELQNRGVVHRHESNRYALCGPSSRPPEQTARGLMLREIADAFGDSAFSRRDVRTLTGRSAFVVDLYVTDLVSEGRLVSVGKSKPRDGGRLVEHYVVAAKELQQRPSAAD